MSQDGRGGGGGLVGGDGGGGGKRGGDHRRVGGGRSLPGDGGTPQGRGVAEQRQAAAATHGPSVRGPWRFPGRFRVKSTTTTIRGINFDAHTDGETFQLFPLRQQQWSSVGRNPDSKTPFAK